MWVSDALMHPSPCTQDDVAEAASLPELVSDSEAEGDSEEELLDSLENLSVSFRGAQAAQRWLLLQGGGEASGWRI